MSTVEQQFAANPRRRQLAIVGGLAVLLLVAVWFFLLRGDGDESTPAVSPAPAAAAPATPEPEGSAPEEKRSKGAGAVETFEVFASRDPFEPLVGETSGTTSSGSTGGDSTSTFIGGDGSTGSGGTGGGSTSGSGDGSSTVGGHRVRVVDVYRAKHGPTAQVEVDSTVYTASEGERFADNFELVSASGQCATMLFGDDQFTLCEGEEILK